MKKRLVTVLGNPRVADETKHEYEKTSYYLPDKPGHFCETSHTFEAILKLTGESYDQVDIIGTVGTKWDSLLLHFPDDSGWAIIENVCKNKNIDKNPQAVAYLEEQLTLSILAGIPCKIHIIEEGRNPEEFWDMFSVISEIGDPGDILTVDITHGFRTIPFFMLLSMQYLKLARGIQPGRVFYGFFDKKEFNGQLMNMGQIMELTSHMQMLDWIQAVNEFQKYGNTKPIADLLDDNPQNREFTKSAKALFENLQLHQSAKIMGLSREFLSTFSRVQKPKPLELLSDSLTSFPKELQKFNSIGSSWQILLKQAHHYYDTNQVSLSVLSLWEACIHQTGSALGWEPPFELESHKILSKILRLHSVENSRVFLLHKETRQDVSISKLATAYIDQGMGNFSTWINKLNGMRNSVAHSDENSKVWNMVDLIADYPQFRKDITDVLESGKWRKFISQYEIERPQ